MQIEKPKLMNQQIYNLLFNQIMDGTLPAGTRLAEEKIAVQLGISRTPVRESILRLEHEGLLRNKCVIEPSLKEIQECYEIRIILEGYAARKAATSMSEDDKCYLKHLIDEADLGDFEATMRAHTEFHSAIVNAIGNDQISQLIERMQAIILLCRKDIVHNRSTISDEHYQIYKAILDGDGDRAEFLMRQHLTENFDNMINRLPSNPSVTVNFSL